MIATPGDLPNALEISDAARSERLARQIRGLTRQLEVRIEVTEALQARLEEQSAALAARETELAAVLVELPALRATAAEYHYVMATKTMRALRLPRRWYGGLRRLRWKLSGRS